MMSPEKEFDAIDVDLAQLKQLGERRHRGPGAARIRPARLDDGADEQLR